MKTTKLLITTLLVTLFVNCGSNKETPDEIITVDVTKKYPEKELILQDFMDVKYIPLETSEEFITQGKVRAIGNNFIIITNMINDGNIFIFDKNGKGVKKINHFGQSGEDYAQIHEVILDEENNEIFVIDYSARKILVYNLKGDFKRSFKSADEGYYNNTFNYDQNSLITHKYSVSTSSMENEKNTYIIISKKDGTVQKEIKIPYKKAASPVLKIEGTTIMPLFQLTAPHLDGWVLTSTSSDTIYHYLSDGTLHPIIRRTPSIHAMNPQIFLFPSIITDQYYFMSTLKKEYDLEKMRGFATTEIMYDKKENALFRYKVYNNDFTDNTVGMTLVASNNEIATVKSLEAYKLVEAYEEDKLKGALKEIAAKLNEEDNPVIMLIKHRK